jgi:peptidoglycan/xylan/chitin deacetylase (PgdA/CDA1 family)
MQLALWAGTGAAATTLVGAAAYAYWRSALGRPPGRLPAVLAYHKVGTPEVGGTWCTRRQFASHLDALQAAGFRAVDVATFESRVLRLDGSQGRDGALAREYLISFDDAYSSFEAYAFPELQERQVPAALFVISDYVGQRARWDLPLPGRRTTHLDWPALRDLSASGIEIGSHTRTHRDLCRLSDTELQDEMFVSKAHVEDALGREVRALSYPFGRCDARVMAAAAGAGYRLGFSMCPHLPNARVEPLALRRWGVYVIDTAPAVLAKVDPTRRTFWMQDLLTRGINAVASVSARASLRHHGAGPHSAG